MFYNFWTTSIFCETIFLLKLLISVIMCITQYVIIIVAWVKGVFFCEYRATGPFFALNWSVRIYHDLHVRSDTVCSCRLPVKVSVQFSVSSTDMMLLGSKRRSPESFLTPAGTICQSWLWFKVSSAINNRVNVCSVCPEVKP